MIKRILLVEDEYDIRQTVKGFLKLMDGYEIYEAENGQQAFEMFGRVNPDLVITDLDMPEMDGVKLTQKIKTVLDSNVPVIMMSAISSPKRKEEINSLLRKGFLFSFLTKPVQLGDLAQALVSLEK